VSTTNPYAPPRGSVYDVAVTDDVELAGRGQRFFAALADAFIFFLMVYFPALMLLLATGALDDSVEIDSTTVAIAVLLCVIGAIGWIWATALLVARNGQTIGKRLLEIKVVRSDGSPASLGRIFWLRNFVNGLLGAIPLYALVDVLFIFGERRQCLHDLIADTIVVAA
jgi:uncharacterized RDD family membrane protein YckC